MNFKNKFCRSVDPATFTPPLTNIPGSAPAVNLKSYKISMFLCFKRKLWHQTLILYIIKLKFMNLHAGLVNDVNNIMGWSPCSILIMLVMSLIIILSS